MPQTEFRWAFPPWQPPGGGLVAIISRAEATHGWIEGLLAVDGDREYVWAGLGDHPERQALEIMRRYGVRVATLAAPGADARRVCLTLQVAAWLERQRGGEGVGSPSLAYALTGWSAPSLPAGAVRVPHLVSARHGTTVSDAVVWELTDAAAAHRWLGLPPDWEFFESHLERLLRLRAAARERRLPATPLARRLLELTHMTGTDLSIEHVYRNGDLFRLLIEAWPEVPSGYLGGDRAA